MTKHDLPHGCTIYCLYEPTEDGGQIVTDFAKLRDGTVHIIRRARFARPVVVLYEHLTPPPRVCPPGGGPDFARGPDDAD